MLQVSRALGTLLKARGQQLEPGLVGKAGPQSARGCHPRQVRSATLHLTGLGSPACCSASRVIFRPHGLKLKVPPWWPLTYSFWPVREWSQEAQKPGGPRVRARPPGPGWSALPSQLPDPDCGDYDPSLESRLSHRRGDLVTDAQPEIHLPEIAARRRGWDLGMCSSHTRAWERMMQLV